MHGPINIRFLIVIWFCVWSFKAFYFRFQTVKYPCKVRDFMIREVMFYDVTSVGSTGLSCTVGMHMLSAAQTAYCRCRVINDLDGMRKEALVVCWQVMRRVSWWDLGKSCKISGLMADVWTRGPQIQIRVGPLNRKITEFPTWCHLFYYLLNTHSMLNMFRPLIRPSSGVCD